MTDKTLADVADHAIDKLSGSAAEIAKAAKSMAPHAWDVAVRAERIDGIASLLIWLLLVATIVVCAKLAVRGSREQNDILLAAPLIMGAFIALGCLIGAFAGGATTLQQIVCPEFAAAKTIMGMLK